MENKPEENIVRLERKIRSIGTQTRWWGIVVFIIGVFMAIIEASSGITIVALGLILSVQGAITQYVFR